LNGVKIYFAVITPFSDQSLINSINPNINIYLRQIKNQAHQNMINNDILRKIRYTFEFSDTKMIELFGSAGLSVTRTQISNWLKKDDDPAYQYISDFQLASFLTGLINEKRGKSEGLQPVPENKLNNNIIFRKIRIALNLKDENILEILELAGVILANMN